MEKELLLDKVEKLKDKMNWIWKHFHLDVEQIMIDFLEEIDYVISHLESEPQDLEMRIIEIKGKANKFLTGNYGRREKEMLKQIKYIKYETL